MDNITWLTEKRKISELIPAPYNPRELTETQAKDLSTSLERFNLADPIIINKDNTIIGGHQRINILKSKVGNNGFEVDVRVPSRSLTKDEERELNLRLNKNLGQWDFDALANFDEALLKDIGFDSKELDKIFQLDAKPEDDDVPDARPTTDIKLGDMFKLGEHILLCGDCTVEANVARLMGGLKADMVFTDMPYGIDKDGIENDNLKADEFDEFNDKYISALPVKENVGFICYHSTRTFNPTINSALRNGWKFEKMMFFYRPDKFPVHTWNGWMMTSQAILLFTKGKVAYRKISPAHQDVYTITSADLIEGKVKHPTIKPIGNICDLLKHFEADVIFDGFGGSGSTLIACEKLNRKCRMMEIDSVYCQVIIDRWEKFTNGKSVKIN